jgi:hypothetical protein
MFYLIFLAGVVVGVCIALIAVGLMLRDERGVIGKVMR